jgi:hypothetical protein
VRRPRRALAPQMLSRECFPMEGIIINIITMSFWASLILAGDSLPVSTKVVAIHGQFVEDRGST